MTILETIQLISILAPIAGAIYSLLTEPKLPQRELERAEFRASSWPSK